MQNKKEIIHTYSAVASDYAEQFCHELDGKPFDRDLLTLFTTSLPKGLPVCDLGCGPGHIGEFIRKVSDHDVLGIDVASGMIEEGKRLYPDLRFQVDDMRKLGLPDDSLSGIVAFYSLIHLERDEVTQGLSEMKRVLVPGGALLLAFHRGEGELTADEWFGRALTYRATLFEPEEITNAMEEVGLEIVDVMVRDPYETEHETERVYVWGKNKSK